MKKEKKQLTLQEKVITALKNFQKELDLATAELETTLQRIDQKARGRMHTQVSKEAQEKLHFLKL